MKTRKVESKYAAVKVSCGCEKDVFACRAHVHPEHTPTPWHVGDAGHTVFGPPNGNPSPFTVATELDKADAAYIVRAVNFHQVLLNIASNLHFEKHPDIKTGCETCEVISNAKGE